jgi:hypothetical protein
VVVKGTEQNGEFVPSGSQHYQLTPDDATMGDATDQRAIREDEAAVLHRLLDTLSIYCARSVVWWENGEEVPPPPPAGATPSLKPDQPSKEQPSKEQAPPKKEDEPKSRPDPPKPVKVGVLAASAARPDAR